MTNFISILAILISLASLVLSFLTARLRCRQYQRAGDNSVQVQAARGEKYNDGVYQSIFGDD